jgi:hypothetical protein
VVILTVPLAVVFYLFVWQRVRTAKRIGRCSAASGSGGKPGWAVRREPSCCPGLLDVLELRGS